MYVDAFNLYDIAAVIALFASLLLISEALIGTAEQEAGRVRWYAKRILRISPRGDCANIHENLQHRLTQQRRPQRRG